MKQFRWLYSIVLVALAAGCTPSVTPSQARLIAEESRPLLEHAFGDIARSQWPAAVAALNPERVYRKPEGLYICTSRFFVEERGVVLPDPAASFVPARGSDPSYEAVANGVFIYRIAG